MLSGTCFAVVASRLFQARAESRPSIGGIAAPLPVATTIAWLGAEQVIADAHPSLAVERPTAAEELDPAFLQPGQLAGVVEVVDHLVAAVEHCLRIEALVDGDPRHALRLGEQIGGPQQRLRGHAGVVGALAADQVLLDDRDREPAVGEPARANLARGPGAKHDRVELLLGHRVFLPDSVQSLHIARGRQASTWSVRANGCRSRLPEASLNPGKNQYVRTMSSPSLPS